MKSINYIVIFLALFTIIKAAEEKVEEESRYIEIYYLPAHRLTGDPSERKDHAVAMNIFVPRKYSKPLPCIILVHGGSWRGGDIGDPAELKSSKLNKRNRYGFSSKLIEVGLSRGFVMVNFNYHLIPKGIFPQVYDDFRDAVRFLRINAEKYNIDPTRIGAVGFSAGGWLITTASWLNGEYFITHERVKHPIKIQDIITANLSKKQMSGIYLTMGHERTEYPSTYGLIQAISFDFQNNIQCVLEQKEFPAINLWCGIGVKIDPAYEEAGIVFSHSELTDEKYKGKGVHVPSLDSPTLSKTGKVITLAERIIEFFEENLVENCRTPLPEIRPGFQIFNKECEISFITPHPSIKVHYTLDGSNPDINSPVYTSRIRIKSDTIVKSFAIMPDRKPSLITTAHFYNRGELIPPKIIKPEGYELPPAEVGKPYEIQFVTDIPANCWEAHGEIKPYIPVDSPDNKTIYPLNLQLDPETGILKGTPDKAGSYWIQIQVAKKQGQIGSLRNYILRINEKNN